MGDRDLVAAKLLYGITEMDEAKARLLVIGYALSEWAEGQLAQQKIERKEAA